MTSRQLSPRLSPWSPATTPSNGLAPRHRLDAASPVRISLREVSPKEWSGTVWHQNAPVVRPLWFPSPAMVHGRYHRVGDVGAWYASLSERGSWAEFFRHWRRLDIDPFRVSRRIARVEVAGLPLLDLTDGATRSLVGVEFEQLISSDWTVCQLVAARVQASRRFHGVLAPGGALPGTTTLVVYASRVNRLILSHERVHRAAASYQAFLDEVRLMDSADYEQIRELYRSRQRHWARRQLGT